MKLLLFILFGCLSTPLLANDGGQLYSLHCSACHGNDGKGGPDGIFPPLANSEWVNGDAKRSILIVLYGLDGPINVAGKAYNLTKPAQGDHLTDDKIAQILTYVRSSWGNAESAVTVDEVKAARDSNVARKKPWRAGELGNVNPQPLGNSAASGNSAPLEKTALIDLVASFYKGNWEARPDLDKFTPESIKNEPSGIIDVPQDPTQDNFAIKWTAKFNAPQKGRYTFVVAANDTAKLKINGKVICELKQGGHMVPLRKQTAEVDLEQGAIPISVEFWEKANSQSIILAWKGPNSDHWHWLSREQQTSFLKPK